VKGPQDGYADADDIRRLLASANAKVSILEV
jgi:hypothetical protein